MRFDAHFPKVGRERICAKLFHVHRDPDNLRIETEKLFD